MDKSAGDSVFGEEVIVSKALQGFKWTTADARSWHDNTFGPWLVGKTLSVEGAKKGDACGHGIHIGKTATNTF